MRRGFVRWLVLLLALAGAPAAPPAAWRGEVAAICELCARDIPTAAAAPADRPRLRPVARRPTALRASVDPPARPSRTWLQASSGREILARKRARLI